MTLTCFSNYFFNSNFSVINLKSNSIFVIISDVEVELISTCESLENLNLEENPLTRDCQDNLSFIAKKQILMTPRELEEWEDLSIEKWKKMKKTWKLWKKIITKERYFWTSWTTLKIVPKSLTFCDHTLLNIPRIV